MDGRARLRVERLLRRLCQMGRADPGLHGRMQLRDRFARVAALEGWAIDCEAVGACNDRRVLVHPGGQPWFNIPWLFQWFHAVLYDFVYGLVPVDTIDPTANRAKAEQIAVGTLVVFDGLIRFLTAWLILKFRHRGPGLWWSAICMTLALGVVFHPIVGI